MGKGRRTRAQRIRRLLILKRSQVRESVVQNVTDALAMASVPAPVQVMTDSVDYSAMTRDALRQHAAEKNIPGRGKMTKAELVAALEAS